MSAFAPSELAAALRELDAGETAFLQADWQVWARDDQLPPRTGLDGESWRVWLILGGRGAGKTRAGAEWVRAKALGIGPVGIVPAKRIALVGETIWRQTVLPLVNRTAKAMSGWLGPAYGGGLELRPDLDQIEALASEREALWTRLGKAEFLSDDEKRAATGYGPKAEEKSGGGGAVKFNPYHDELGRFTTGDGGGDTAIVPVAFRPRGGGGKPPPSPPPPAKPAQPHTPGLPPGAGGQAQPTPPKPSEQRLEEILKPGGKEIGERLGGAKERIRSIEKTEFDTLRSKLLDGSKEVPTPTEYRGKWYERPDGTRFGVRESTESGTTIDVINGGKSGLENGYRIHQK